MEELLLKVGVNPTLDGFRYLAYMAQICEADHNAHICELYDAAAQHFGVNWRSVERCCRHAIARMLDTSSFDVIDRVLLQLPDPYKGGYTVGQFVVLLALAHQREQSPV